MELFNEEVKSVCEIYKDAQELNEQGTNIVSTDEMTGIQALERKCPTKPMIPGFVERREFEYIRHGTQSLIASFNVATGEIIKPLIGPTRKEDDFAEHIYHVIETDSDARWVFILDQLNTHKSESLVRLVAECCNITDDLGRKGKSGILKNMESRSSFLRDVNHRIRFVYVPKHTSWLNQIEIWFSILMRRLLKRANFISTEDLKQRILNFIDYFNQTMAKPFKWTYAGRPLVQ